MGIQTAWIPSQPQPAVWLWAVYLTSLCTTVNDECGCAVAQSCPILCDPVDCSPPGCSVPGILQARILEWAAISFSRGSSQPRDWTLISFPTGRFLTIWATGKSLAWLHLSKMEIIVPTSWTAVNIKQHDPWKPFSIVPGKQWTPNKC